MADRDFCPWVYYKRPNLVVSLTYSFQMLVKCDGYKLKLLSKNEP